MFLNYYQAKGHNCGESYLSIISIDWVKKQTSSDSDAK